MSLVEAKVASHAHSLLNFVTDQKCGTSMAVVPVLDPSIMPSLTVSDIDRAMMNAKERDLGCLSGSVRERSQWSNWAALGWSSGRLLGP